MNIGNIVLVVLVVLIVFVIYLGIKIVPQSKVFVVERFGKFTRLLESGLSIIVPFIDRVAFRVDILERQLPPFKMSVITEDNVEVELVSTVFFRVLDAAKSVYRIRNIDLAIENTAISVIRSAAGKLQLDDLQSSREAMNQEIATRLSKAAEVWGVEVTRTEILDVLVDEKTKDSQRQQLNAERESLNISEQELNISKGLYLPTVTLSGSKSEESTDKLTDRTGANTAITLSLIHI